MIPSSNHRFCTFPCVSIGFILLSMIFSVGWAGAADKEQRLPDSAAFNSDATFIVYTDKVTPPGELLPTNSEIWTVFSDGQGRRCLTSGHKDTHPCISPDGKQIIFERDGDGDIWMMNFDGGNVHNLTNTPKVYEHGAQFSNDGASLFLLSPAQGFTDVLVQLNLNDGTRRQLLGEEYAVKAVFPEPDDDKVALVLCNAVDANGKAILWTDATIVAVPLDGSSPCSVFKAPKGYDISMARSGGAHLVIYSSVPGKYGSQTFLLKKAGANTATVADLKHLEEIAFLGDLSCDGKSVIGSAITSGIDHWGIMSYDTATEKYRTVME
ncbi:hypothetical protein IAD21_00420 [Abditibacteriota bacterium]|nr:hypothetical protein IAD21_00420 [Abditibacteriota bacterium]